MSEQQIIGAREMRAEIARLRALLEKAESVIEPFKVEAAKYGPANADDAKPFRSSSFAIGDLRAAASLLSEIRKEAARRSPQPITTEQLQETARRVEASRDCIPRSVSVAEADCPPPTAPRRVCVVTDALCSQDCTDRCARVPDAKAGEWS